MAASLYRCRRALAAALGLLLTCSQAFAQDVDDADRNAARSLAGQAKESFDRGEYEKAQDLFHRAYQLVQAPTISLYEARALVKLGRLVAAEEAYTRTVRTHLDPESSDQFRKAVREAVTELSALQPRIPRLVINVTGAGARDPRLTVSLDGAPVKSALVGVEMPIDPGMHELTAQAGAGPSARQSVTVQEAERKTVELLVDVAPTAVPATSAPLPVKIDLAPPAPPEGLAWQKKAAFVAGGVGIAGLGLGIVSGVMASSRYSTAEQECPEHKCLPGSAGDDAVQSFRSLKTVSTVGYVIGGVGLAAGITLFVTAPSKKAEQRARLSVFLRGDQAGVAGVF